MHAEKSGRAGRVGVRSERERVPNAGREDGVHADLVHMGRHLQAAVVQQVAQGPAPHRLHLTPNTAASTQLFSTSRAQTSTRTGGIGRQSAGGYVNPTPYTLPSLSSQASCKKVAGILLFNCLSTRLSHRPPPGSISRRYRATHHSTTSDPQRRLAEDFDLLHVNPSIGCWNKLARGKLTCMVG